MDQFTNQLSNQQHPLPRITPSYNYYSHQQTFTASHMRLDIGHVRHDMGHTRPDIGHVRHDMGHTRPDIGHVRPDIGHVRPDMGHMRPDIGHMRPEMGYSQRGLLPSPPDLYMYRGPYNPRPTLYPQDMHQAAIQREMEKQKIREEIMNDMARRREIEEEVRRELKMEAELALRTGIPLGLSTGVMGTSGLAITRSPLENRIALSDEERTREDKELETMPFQRGKSVNLRISKAVPVLERGEEKKKIVLMAKPGKNTSGSKRKAETPPAVDASDEPRSALILKRKTKKEWTCALCQISASSEHGLNEHLKGKKHKSKKTASRANRTGKNYVIGLLSNITTESTHVASEPLKKEPELTAKVQRNGGWEENKFRYWCEVCEVGTHSMKVMQNHKDGKVHLRRTKKLLKVETVEEMDGGSGKIKVETET